MSLGFAVQVGGQEGHRMTHVKYSVPVVNPLSRTLLLPDHTHVPPSSICFKFRFKYRQYK